jgi:hypothetical protein
MTVSQIYAEKAPLCRYIPIYLGLHVQRLLHSAGVRYINERLVTDVKGACLSVRVSVCVCVCVGWAVGGGVGVRGVGLLGG